MKLYRTGHSHGRIANVSYVEHEGLFYRIPIERWDDLVNHPDLAGYLVSLVVGAERAEEFDPRKVLAPLESQSVWAAGVTYHRSRSARMAEARRHRRRRFLRARVYGQASGTLLQGWPRIRSRARPACAHSARREVVGSRARVDGASRRARPDCRLHRGQRHELARHRGREPALSSPGQSLRPQLRAGPVHYGGKRTASGDNSHLYRD